jgi:hypothetical protein
MDEATVEKVFRSAIRFGATTTLDLVLAERAEFGEISELTGEEIDEALRELRRRGWLRGERQEGDGSIAWWSNIRPTVHGLRELGEWPAEGEEHLPGGWDELTWGQTDRPELARLEKSPPSAGFLERPGIGDSNGWESWESDLRLHEAGLIDGEFGEGYLSGVRLTSLGMNALHPPADDPLIRARVKLRTGAKADAVTAAIDEALKPRLRALAIADGMRAEDVPDKLGNLNDQLKAHGVYGPSSYGSEATRSQVEAWIKLRNVVDHGEGALVSDRRIELLIDGIAEFFVEYPDPSSTT